MTLKAAQILGRMAKGKPKNYSRSERQRRAKRLTAMNKALEIVIHLAQKQK